MSYEQAYLDFVQHHTGVAYGERARRLSEGLGHAEKRFLQEVWWPAVGHFDYLHPEFEVSDFKDGQRYLDFAYLRAPFKVCIEIDGYGPHLKDISRWKFADQLMRQNHLVIDGWFVIRFSYDDIAEKPRRCQQLVQQLLGRWFGDEVVPAELTFKAKEIVRLAVHKQTLITPADVCARLGVSDRYARTLLKGLVQQGILAPAAGTARVRSYRLTAAGQRFFL
ncbi:DNA-binding response regulator [Paenibacillus cremeus]|uniref:DNA-binding response regulator n=1 Tax=Paenibacillus cremeus TaxID=2163881 RepID=A0A559JPW0_9BACL|nr:DNA-binding response regulator [Paenibacillus cremeus]TVY01911.1 DNA-binding response regulator [Paenibacillus cremeus]